MFMNQVFNNSELLEYNIHLKWCKDTGLKINWLGRVLLFDNGAETNTELHKKWVDKILCQTDYSRREFTLPDPYQTTKLNVKHL